MKQCEYQSNEKRCKNWVVNGNDDDSALCPIHAGILKRAEPTVNERQANSRFEQHATLCDEMNDEQLQAHILQLESLLEDVKLRQQAAASVRQKRLKAQFLSGALSQEQLEELRIKRSGNHREPKAEPKISKEEKEIQSLMKKGLSREKAIKLLSME